MNIHDIKELIKQLDEFERMYLRGYLEGFTDELKLTEVQE